MTQRRGPAGAVVQQWNAAPAGEHTQAKARMRQPRGLLATKLALQQLRKHPADFGRAGPLAGGHIELLVDVALGQGGQGRVGVHQPGAGLAPGTDQCAQQVHGVCAALQPVAKQVAVQRVQDQTLGAAGGGRDHPHIVGLQATLAQVFQRAGAGTHLQGTVHDHRRAASSGSGAGSRKGRAAGGPAQADASARVHRLWLSVWAAAWQMPPPSHRQPQAGPGHAAPAHPTRRRRPARAGPPA